MPRYDHQSIERKWQERWATSHAHEARDPEASSGRAGDARPKEYLLVEFPYPSGDGLHVGHIRPYVALDVIARKHRMEGKNVLYPIGWDAFGLPTENYAIKMGIHPAVATKQNTDRFRRQIQSLGISFDWSREVNTTDPAYYKWTQWIFLQFLKHGLAHKARMPINWCTRCKIGLANEEVVGGVCERCGGAVEKRDREQWMLKITAYAEKLLAGLETVDYIERAKVQQVNWIGRSEGATLMFRIVCHSERSEESRSSGVRDSSSPRAPQDDTIKIFTTRPDTLLGATYLVLAPEHPLVEQLLPPSSSRAPSPPSSSRAKREISQDGNMVPTLTNADEVRAYIAATHRKTDIERTNAEREKTGVELRGVKAVNPANGEEIPVWVADYVLAHYGTGAIMAVPAHDERDFAFAQKYGLPIREVIASSGASRLTTHDSRLELTYTDDGILVNSSTFTGTASEDAKRAITEAVGGEMTVTYKLRDWVFSRQRYWGEPIPVVFCPNCAKDDGMRNAECRMQNVDGVPCAIIPVPEDQLPVELPNVEKYQPTETGDSPLAAITDWVNTKCPQCGGPAKRETDVMPNWAGSSWYFLAYAMHRSLFPPSNVNDRWSNVRGQWSDVPLKYWMPVDWYNGGMEHTTLHLLYSRFWNLFLYDIGAVPVAEPYAKRTSHGLILASDGEKMSKSRGNVVNPDEIVEQFGADAVRVYEMFIGPFDQPVPWSTDGLIGCRRFLEKVVALAERVEPRSGDLQVATSEEGRRAHRDRGGLKASATPNDDVPLRLLHRTIKKATPERRPEERSDEGSHIIDPALLRLLHRTVKKVSEDIEAMRFNTAVSALMEFTNALGKRLQVSFSAYATLLTLLTPFAPHLCEELWERLHSQVSSLRTQVSMEPWPSHDPVLVVEEEIDLVIQVNGKLRATIRVPAGMTEDDARTRALAEPNVQKYLSGKEPKRVIVVPGKLVNVVVS